MCVRRLGRTIPALAMLAALLAPMPSQANHPPLLIMELSPSNNQITFPPGNIHVQFNQCVLAPPSSYLELRSPYGTLVSVFVSMPNCSTIQIGPTETVGSGQYSIFIYGITVGGSSTSMSTVFYVDDEIPAPPDPAMTHPINEDNETNVRVWGTGEPGSTAFVTIDDNNGATPAIACGVSGAPPCPVVGQGGFFNAGPFNVSSLDDSPVPTSGIISTLSIKATVTLTDPAMNVSPPRYAYAFKDTIDPAAPVIDFPANNATNANQRWTISGRVVNEPGYRHMDVVLYDNNVASVTTRGRCRDTECGWHGTLLMNPSGTHSVYARAKDAAGNVGPASATRALNLSGDTATGPVRPSVELAPDPIKNDVSASGAAQSGGDVRIKIGANPYVVCATGSNGSPPNYACGPFDTSAEAAGIATILMRDFNANGGITGVSMLKDVEIPNAPTVQFSDPDPWVNAQESSAVRLNGNAEPLSTVSGSVSSSGGGTPILFSTTADLWGNWSASTNVSTLNDGVLTGCVVSTDARGNATASVCTGAGPTLDKTAPPAPVILVPAEAAIVTSTTFNVSGTAGGGAISVDVFEGTIERGSGTAAAFGGAGIATTVYTDGPHTIRARSTDQAGNISPLSVPRNFILDANGPYLVSTTPPNGGLTNPSALLTANYADPDHANLASCSFQVRDKGGVLALGTISISGLSCNFDAATNALTVAGSPYTATVQVTDPAGNSSPPDSFTFNIDDVPPAAPVWTYPPQNAIVGGPTFNVTGTAEAGSQVQIFNGALFLGATTANPNWSLNLSFSDGFYTLTAFAVDPAGNVGPGANRSFTVDLTPPSAPVITSPASGATVPGNTPVTGTAENGTTVKLFEGAVLLGQTVATPSWSITPALTDGPHTVTAFSYDSVGNQSAGTSRSYIVDLSAPNVPIITAPAEGAFVNSTNVTVTGSAEAGSMVTIKEGSTVLGTTPATPAFSIALSFTQGSHTIVATATDLAGNVSTSAQRTFTVDTTPPNAPVIVTPIAGSTLPATFLVQGTAERSSLVEVYEGVTLLGSTTSTSTGFWELSLTLSDGTHTIKARQTDQAGNVGPFSANRSFTVDAIPPGAPVIITPAASSINGATVTISGTAEPFGTITLFDGADFLGSTNVTSGGAWSKSVTLEDGNHGVVARQTDLAGNLGPFSAVRSFITDGTPPDATIDSPSSPIAQLPPVTLTTPVITGRASDLANGSFSAGLNRVVVQIYNLLDASPVQQGNAACAPGCGTGAADVAWSFTPSPLLPGIYRIRVTAIDEAGNAQAPPEERLFITLGGPL